MNFEFTFPPIPIISIHIPILISVCTARWYAVRRTRYCHGKSSVRLSVCDIEVL